MSWNGRFRPFEEEREENDPDRDFPIQEKVLDFADKEHEFEITYQEMSLGYILDATEKGNELGYHFTAFDANSPYLALGKLRGKMQRAMSTKHLRKEKHGYHACHDELNGRLTCRDGELCFVVDGIALSLGEFGRIVETHEGWEFRFQFIDRAAD